MVKRVVRARRKAKTKPTAAPPRLTTNREAGGGVGCQHDPWTKPGLTRLLPGREWRRMPTALPGEQDPKKDPPS